MAKRERGWRWVCLGLKGADGARWCAGVGERGELAGRESVALCMIAKSVANRRIVSRAGDARGCATLFRPAVNDPLPSLQTQAGDQ